MEEKNSYTLAEVAMMMEAYRRTYEEGMPTEKDLAGYKNLVPESVRSKLSRLRDMIYSVNNITLAEEKRKEIRERPEFKEVEEFFKAFKP